MKFITLKDGLIINLAQMTYASVNGGIITLFFGDPNHTVTVGDPVDVDKLKALFASNR
jgi:hypothetical protein